MYLLALCNEFGLAVLNNQKVTYLIKLLPESENYAEDSTKDGLEVVTSEIRGKQQEAGEERILESEKEKEERILERRGEERRLETEGEGCKLEREYELKKLERQRESKN